MYIRNLTLTIALVLCSSAMATDPSTLSKEVVVRASLDDVWNAWTTADGLAFISKKSNVDLRLNGPYEWFLDLGPDENGISGSEGSRILAYLPREMLAFSWTFPPDVPELRNARETTQVVVRFTDQGNDSVLVRLDVIGWKDGEPWQRGYEYFDEAWGYVLEALKEDLETRS
ncbi:MAG: SRPBCC domain-containing protein [Woeseiaceae bacterium]